MLNGMTVNGLGEVAMDMSGTQHPLVVGQSITFKLHVHCTFCKLSLAENCDYFVNPGPSFCGVIETRC